MKDTGETERVKRKGKEKKVEKIYNINTGRVGVMEKKFKDIGHQQYLENTLKFEDQFRFGLKIVRF